MNFKLESIETSSTGLDAFFEQEPQVITPHGQEKQASAKPTGRVKVSSLNQLQGFVRSSADTLIHKSTQDLWALRQDGDNYFIERLFSESGAPLKG